MMQKLKEWGCIFTLALNSVLYLVNHIAAEFLELGERLNWKPLVLQVYGYFVILKQHPWDYQDKRSKQITLKADINPDAIYEYAINEEATATSSCTRACATKAETWDPLSSFLPLQLEPHKHPITNSA